MKTVTRETYSQRIAGVQEYLAQNLDQDLDFYRLADEAFMSPYHFHRVYVAMMGETLSETIRRRRLHKAAMQLLASSTAIAKLANLGGYTSVQAFNRAFRDAYEVTPYVFAHRRKNRRTFSHIYFGNKASWRLSNYRYRVRAPNGLGCGQRLA
jgi:AraC family transcriptional regulator